MKKIVLIMALLLGIGTTPLTLARESVASDAQVMRIMDNAGENLTAFSGSNRSSALEMFRSRSLENASKEVKLHALGYLAESVVFFSASTSIKSQELVRDIALTSNDIEVAIEAMDILEAAVSFRVTASARERISAVECLLAIANSENFNKNSEVLEHAADLVSPYMDSYLDRISLPILEYLEHY